jgi:aminocarboxymuconate-semialdehyde decarboxylase
MDEMGVGLQVLTCSLVHQCTYWMAPEDSLRFERLANDTMAAKIRANPSRLRGFGGVPLQAPKLAVQELERAVGELGLTGIQISTSAAGREVGHPDLHPFWAKAQEMGAVIYIHPAGNHDARLKPWFLWNSIGQSYEEAMAIASLMYEGVLDKYPDLRICISHGGGYMPFNFGRITRNWLEKPASRINMKQPPADFLKMLWYDSCLYSTDLLKLLVDVVGEDRILLGSDYPVGDRKPVATIRSAGLGADVEEKILRTNAERFLGL